MLSLRSLLWVVLVVGALLASSRATSATQEAELEALRERIIEIQNSQQDAIDERADVIGQLQAAEKNLAALNRELNSLANEIAVANAQLAEFKQQEQQAQLQLNTQKTALAEQIRAAYTAGREEKLKLLLNQQDPAQLGRMLTYYAYLNQARAESITAVRASLSRLAQLSQDIRAEHATLKSLYARRQKNHDKISQAQVARKKVLSELAGAIASRDSRLRKLRRDEKALQMLVRRLQDAFTDIPDNLGKGSTFSSQRGRLNWPINGRIVHRYGEARGGGMQWQGVMINTTSGAQVQAVAKGRVAYADWLPHYGMLIIIEHGDGYMSLYGHNQALYAQAGDWVQQGDTIATVGDTGGRDESGLYFEIRKKGDPINPIDWLARQ